MPKKTFLYDLHLRHNARVVDFHGWLLPIQYEGILAEQAHCRSAVSLFDTCHMGQFLIYGPSAAADLAGLLTHDVRKLPIGKSKYGLMLNENGGILDDTIVLRLGQREFLLVVNAGPVDSDFEWVSQRLSSTTRIINQSSTWGKIDLQGPKAFGVLNKRVEEELSGLTYFAGSWARCCGRDCILSRTGYTGELGYEIFAPAGDIVAITESLLSEPSVRLAGLGARDALRLEMCYPLYDQDMNRSTNPIEADMARFVSLEHEYVGHETVRRTAAEGPKRLLAAFVCEGRRRANTGDPIVQGDVTVGEVTSGAFSPALNLAIGMGYVRSDLARSSVQLTVRTERAEVPITIQDKPLYKAGTCRTRQLTRE